ncbi:hypothetical protein ACNFNZ_05220 [Empedobacter brevis]
MKTNIFLNSYQQPENKLTYNFFSIIEILNCKNLFDFLTNNNTIQNSLTNLRFVYGGGETNPDGSFELTLENGNKITVFYENKTGRRSLDANQLIGHLTLCDDDDILLVTSPRKSDIEIIKNLADERIIFKTWQEISLFLKNSYPDNLIIKQFNEYGKKSGEFDELGEIYHEDIKVYSEYMKIDFDKKTDSIFRTFLHEIDFEKFGFRKIRKYYQNDWGRKGIEFTIENCENKSFGQFGAISLYYDTEDHIINFLKNTPELAFFFDVDPKFKNLLQQDNDFRELIKNLEFEGFESNLDNDKTPNEWRLLYYRKPITEFQILNVQEIITFAESILLKIITNNSMNHKYFKEFQ